jgi:hypothetical protein
VRSTQHIQRPQQGRGRSVFPAVACGCLGILGTLAVVIVLALLFFRPNLTELVARVAGFAPTGSTEAIFAQATPVPTLVLENAVQPTQVTVYLGEYGTETLGANNNLYDFTIGSGAGGEQMALASFTEQGLLDLCRQRTTLCSENPADPRFRNARIDLRPGGAVIYADVTLPELGGISQTAGVVLRLDSTRRQFEFAGVDIGGMLYSVPPQSFGTMITDVEARGNQLLNQLSIDAAGGQYSLSEVVIDDQTLTLVLR